MTSGENRIIIRCMKWKTDKKATLYKQLNKKMTKHMNNIFFK